MFNKCILPACSLDIGINHCQNPDRSFSNMKLHQTSFSSDTLRFTLLSYWVQFSKVHFSMQVQFGTDSLDGSVSPHNLDIKDTFVPKFTFHPCFSLYTGFWLLAQQGTATLLLWWWKDLVSILCEKSQEQVFLRSPVTLHSNFKSALYNIFSVIL